MKVYVVVVTEPVEFGTYTSIEGVFSTKEKAESYVNVFNHNPRRKSDLMVANYEDWNVE